MRTYLQHFTVFILGRSSARMLIGISTILTASFLGFSEPLLAIAEKTQ